ncbi:MAG: DUF4276 family protein [Elusimicrobia bacterium]|nr:DUF4276 family protein [Elusimicrobiota bacterium]
MKELVFLLEEESAKEMLKSLLPRILPYDITPQYFVFEGKQDLENQLIRKLKGYRVPNAKFVILRDQDASDCRIVKNSIIDKCNKTGRKDVLVRIVCREIESWYLADLAAVEQGLNVSKLVQLQNKNMYRTPDNIVSPSKRLKKIAPKYQKVSGSRAIGPFLDLNNNRSHSFAVFIAGIKKLCGIS